MTLVFVRKGNAEFEVGMQYGRAVIWLIDDNTNVSVGPSGFPRASLQACFAKCDIITVIPGKLVREDFAALASLTESKGGWMAIIECSPQTETDWFIFSRKAKPCGVTAIGNVSERAHAS